jgi:hypothetical protein
MTPFLRLDDFLIPPPFPAAIAVLMCLGLKHFGDRLVNVFDDTSSGAVKSAAAFVLATGLVAFSVNLMAIIGIAHVYLLRIIAWLISGFGVIELFRLKHDCFNTTVSYVKKFILDQALLGKLSISLVGATILFLWLASLGPPTDADSLDYHLGVPLDILRNHQLRLRPDWFHARLIGLGEALNLLGLAGGTDILGSSLQFSGLVVALIAVVSFAKTDSDRILGAMIVVGCPLMLFLIPNQKPQMLPAAGIVIALVMIVQNHDSMDMTTLVLAFGTVCFSIACKYSFLIPGSVVLVMGFVAAYKNGKFCVSAIIGIVSFVVFLIPLYLQKFVFYGDPISPLLERFLYRDPGVMYFAQTLKEYKDSPLGFPLGLIFPISLGTIGTTLGVGALLIFSHSMLRRTSRVLFVCAMTSGLMILLMGQVASRFFLEPYLWIAGAFTASASSRVKTVFSKLMLVQITCVCAMAAFAAATLFPGGLTPALRHEVMLRHAYQYGASNWLDTILPSDAVVLTDLRSKALMPRHFMSNERISYWLKTKRTEDLDKVRLELKKYGIDTWVTQGAAPDPFLNSLFPEPVSGPESFWVGTRNPWNASTSLVRVYKLLPY